MGEGKMTGMLLMDFKVAFDHISRNGLIRKVEVIGADGNLVRYTGRSFRNER